MNRTPEKVGTGGSQPKHARPARRDWVWWAGLVVACAAAAATAHGLYAVAAASDVPWPVAVLYPVMTDGLALVAYSATNRLTDRGRRYAWSVVVLAAGLSGAAQAVYLASGGVDEAGPVVRFGIGAAPALAAAAVAHLLHLIRTAATVRPEPVQPDPVQSGPDAPVGRPAEATTPRPVTRRGRPPALTATDRARTAAEQYRERHGVLPTVSVLIGLTKVSRGTAGTVLKGLRVTADDESPAPAPDDTEPAPDDRPTHPEDKIQNHYTPMHHDLVDERPQAGAGS